MNIKYKLFFALISILIFSCNQALTSDYIISREWKHAGGPRLMKSDVINFNMFQLKNDTIFMQNKPYAMLINSHKSILKIKNEEIEVKLFTDSISSIYCDFGSKLH